MNDPETGAAPADYPVRSRILILLLLLSFLAGAMGYSAWQTACLALQPGNTPAGARALLLFLALLLVSLPAYILGAMVRRKWRTGRFFLSRSESAALRAARLRRMGAGKPFRQQAGDWSTHLIVLAIPCILASLLLIWGVDAFAVLDTRKLSLFLFAASVLLLLPPGWVALRMLRRRQKTGFYLPSEQELAASQLKWGTPQSLRRRIFAAVLNSVVAVIWIQHAYRHLHRSHQIDYSDWGAALAWCAIASIWVWQIFRPRACPLPPADGGPPSGVSRSL